MLCVIDHLFLLAGFDLVDVGKDEVTIRTGKQASKRIIQCAVQALIVLFNTQVRILVMSTSMADLQKVSHISISRLLYIFDC